MRQTRLLLRPFLLPLATLPVLFAACGNDESGGAPGGSANDTVDRVDSSADAAQPDADAGDDATDSVAADTTEVSDTANDTGTDGDAEDAGTEDVTDDADLEEDTDTAADLDADDGSEDTDVAEDTDDAVDTDDVLDTDTTADVDPEEDTDATDEPDAGYDVDTDVEDDTATDTYSDGTDTYEPYGPEFEIPDSEAGGQVLLAIDEACGRLISACGDEYQTAEECADGTVENVAYDMDDFLAANPDLDVDACLNAFAELFDSYDQEAYSEWYGCTIESSLPRWQVITAVDACRTLPAEAQNLRVLAGELCAEAPGTCSADDCLAAFYLLDAVETGDVSAACSSATADLMRCWDQFADAYDYGDGGICDFYYADCGAEDAARDSECYGYDYGYDYGY